ncbi:MAG: hypothetical protein JNM94_12360 [Phycisphaerae bacterium]|nr:hypothetical protein [Phycisphaerae bacterium]
MPDVAPLLVAILSLVATVTLGVAIVGRRDLSDPRCRRCKADLRDAAMTGAGACACGSDLSRPRAVRYPYRLRWRTLSVAAMLALGAFLLGLAETRVISSGLGWRYVHPNWYFRLDWLASEGSELDEKVLAQRVQDLRSRDDAASLLGSMLRKPLPPGSSTFVSFAQVVEKAAPRDELAARCAETIASRIALDLGGRTLAFELWGFRYPLTAYMCMCVRVDCVKVDGVEVPFEREGDRFADGASDVWRRFGHSRAVARLPDMPLDRCLVEVEGETIFLPFPVSGDWPMRDATLRRTANPAEWGIEVMRAPFAISNAPTSPAVTLPQGPTQPSARVVALREWFAPFLGNPSGRREPMRLAARTPLTCGVVGILCGLCVLPVFLLVRRASCSRWRLDVAACLGCGSRLRAEGVSVPAQCPECGRETVRLRVGYGTRTVSVALAVTLGVFGAVLLVVFAALFVPLMAARAGDRVHRLVWDTDRVATWSADQRLAGVPPLVELRRALPEPTPISRLVGGGVMDDTSELGLADRMCVRWAAVNDARGREGRPLSRLEQVGWIYAMATGVATATAPDGRGDPSMRLERLRSEFTAMRDAFGYPGIRLPRAVRVDDSIRPRCTQNVEASVVHVRATHGSDSAWTPVLEATVGQATDVGVTDVSFEWSLQGLSSVEGCAGTFEGAVRVFPAAGRVTAVTEPTFNPLDGEAIVTLEIRETGDRDLVTIVADDASVGVALAGSWRLGDVAGPATPSVLGRQVDGAWVGLVSLAEWTGDEMAGQRARRPNELVATFVPDTNAKPVRLPRVGTVSIVWGAETTVRFRRIETSPFDVVTRYELVP